MALTPMPPAIAVSALLHAAVLALALVGTLHRSASAPVTPPPEHGASWAGDLLEVDGVEERPSSPPTAETPAPAPPEPPPSKDPEAAPALTPPKPAATEPERSPEKPARDKPPKRDPRTGDETERAAGEGSGKTEASSAASPPATPGMSGEAPGVANLGKAFTKAITAATHRDRIWDDLPLGAAGSVRVAITTDEQGSIADSVIADRERVPKHMLTLAERTLLFLKAGRFALSKGSVGTGTEKLKIEVTLSSGEPDPDADDPRHTTEVGFEPPSATKPGRAYFTHASGRHFEAKVTLETGR